MSSGRIFDPIRRWWSGLAFFWKYQILFWGIYNLGSFPTHYIGLRYVVHWQTPLYGIVFLKLVETAISILLTMGFGKMLATAWFRRQTRWRAALWICLGTLAVVLVTNYIERPFILKRIYEYFGMYPSIASSGERDLKRLALSCITFLLYGGWAGIYVIARASSEAKRQEQELQASEMKRRDIEIQMLRSQLNPHFLFNAMNTIASQSGGNEKVDHLVEGISDYLRYSLANRSRTLVSLGEEIDATARYLGVEKIRFGDTLEFEIDAEPASHPVPVPGIFLQPIVENALKYGGRDSPPPLRIRILCRYRDGRLLVEISNTGSWVAPDPDRDPKAGGVGFENLRARLTLLYPGRHEFATASAGGWSTVRLVIRDPVAKPADGSFFTGFR